MHLLKFRATLSRTNSQAVASFTFIIINTDSDAVVCRHLSSSTMPICRLVLEALHIVSCLHSCTHSCPGSTPPQRASWLSSWNLHDLLMICVYRDHDHDHDHDHDPWPWPWPWPWWWCCNKFAKILGVGGRRLRWDQYLKLFIHAWDYVETTYISSTIPIFGKHLCLFVYWVICKEEVIMRLKVLS